MLVCLPTLGRKGSLACLFVCLPWVGRDRWHACLPAYLGQEGRVGAVSAGRSRTTAILGGVAGPDL